MLRWIACCPMTIAKGLSRVLPILPNCSTLRCRSLAHMHVLIVLILCLYAEHAGNTFQRLEKLHWITTKSFADSYLPKANTRLLQKDQHSKC